MSFHPLCTIFAIFTKILRLFIDMFYDNGLRFQCQMCRYCCSSEPGYVYLSDKEIEEEADYLGLSREEFIRKYCRYVDCGEYSLISLQETSRSGTTHADRVFLS